MIGKNFKNLFIYGSMLCFLGACAPENNSMSGRAYHNTTARYNAYFIARENLREVEEFVRNAEENNYNRILNVFPLPDTAKLSSQKPALENVIKMASLAIQRHPESNWVDDSYILVGRARYHLGEYSNAIETFKYVNTKSEDDHARHEALIHLMRTFTDYNEMNNARAVAQFLNKQKLNKKNKRKFLLVKAYFYQRNEDLENMVKNLSEATPLMRKKDGKAKVQFITGQVYQQLEFNSEAYRHYQSVLSSSPPYELSFYTKLYMAQVAEITRGSDLRRTRKYFKRLLKDAKNKEFKDKIYYEMAEFEYKQDNLDLAIEYYKNSVQNSVNNQRQKSYSYYKLGKIYYEKMAQYELAKSYYDSTVSVMPKDEPEYAAIKERQEILAEFVKHITSVRLQDSLLRLSNMDSASLSLLMDEIEEQRKLEALALEKANKKKSRSLSSQPQFSNFGMQANQAFNPNMTDASGTWYFYNLAQVGNGQNEFRQKWGNRPLKDNWRLISRVNESDFDDGKEDELAEVAKQAGELAKEDKQEESGEKKYFDREGFMAQIPFTDEQKAEAYKKLDEGHFQLGRLYHFNLDEDDNAIISFKKVLEYIKESEHRVESLYLLYIILKEREDPEYERYRDMIVEEFPQTLYAKVILNPNYLEEAAKAGEEVKLIYEAAYKAYVRDDIKEAQDLINRGINDFAENEFTDNLRLLEILIVGKTEDYYKYVFALNNFKEENPDSELLAYVDILIKKAEEFKKEQERLKEIKFSSEFSQKHVFVLLYESNKTMAEALPKKFEAMHGSNFAGNNLTTGNLIFDDKMSMILISEFEDKSQSEAYMSVFNQKIDLKKEYPTAKFHTFVISNDNFQVFYQSKDLNAYLNFFKQHYAQ